MRLNKHLLALCSTLFVGCASSDNPLEEEVFIHSNPTGAMVELNGQRIGRTPIRATLDRTRNHEITVDKSGFEARSTTLRPSLKPNNTYGFGGKVSVVLDAEGSQDKLTAEDREALDRIRESTEAPTGVDPAIYGTFEGDLAEAKVAAAKLASLADKSREAATKARAELAAALTAAQDGEGKDTSEAEAKLQEAEAGLKKAIADAETAEAKAKLEQEIVQRRLVELGAAREDAATAEAKAAELSTAAKGVDEAAKAAARADADAAKAKATSEAAAIEAAKASAEAATRAAADARAALATATAALEAAAKARAEVDGSVDNQKIAAALAEADNRKVTGEALAEKLAQASATVAARVDELAKVVAAKNSVNAAEAAVEGAGKDLAQANARIAALELRIREHAYGEYTARKGLLERRLRTGELNRETYRELLAELDKEIRGR
jgi:hypothetical protein